MTLTHSTIDLTAWVCQAFPSFEGCAVFTLVSFSYTCVSTDVQQYLFDYKVRYHSVCTPTGSDLAATHPFGYFMPIIWCFRHASKDMARMDGSTAIPMESSLRICTLYAYTCRWLQWKKTRFSGTTSTSKCSLANTPAIAKCTSPMIACALWIA